MSNVSDSSAGDRTADPPSGEDPRPLDATFEVLTARRRRYALYVLSRTADPTTLSTLAEAVAALEDGDADRVATSLAHVHLPKLAENGVVNYDAEDGTVGLADCSGRLRRLLTLAAENERQSLGRPSDGFQYP